MNLTQRRDQMFASRKHDLPVSVEKVSGSKSLAFESLFVLQLRQANRKINMFRKDYLVGINDAVMSPTDF